MNFIEGKGPVPTRPPGLSESSEHTICDAASAVNTAEALRFLQALFPDLGGVENASDGQIAVFTLPSRACRFCESAAVAADYGVAAAAVQDVYVGVGVYRAGITVGRGKREDVVAITSVWADIDFGSAHKKPGIAADEATAMRVVERIGVAPSIVVRSGHGLHCYWLLTEPLTEGMESLARRWSNYIGSVAREIVGVVVDSVPDVTRVLRLPGTVNRKVPDDLRTVTILTMRDIRYEPSDLLEWCPDVAVAVKPVDPAHCAFVRNASATPAAPLASSAMTDDAIFETAGTAKNAEKFLALWNGDDTGYPSPSEGDLALCSMLAFYTPDPVRIDALFRKSKRLRAKWERADYRAATIAKSLAGLSAVYDPQYRSDAATTFHTTDTGNGERLVARHGSDFRFCKQRGTWLVWGGHRWIEDNTFEMQRFAVDSARSILAEAQEESDVGAGLKML